MSVNEALQKCQEKIDTEVDKSGSKLDAITKKCNSGDIQTKIRDMISRKEFEEAKDTIDRARGQMDKEYNLIEKLLETLGANCDKAVVDCKLELKEIT